MSVLVKVIGGSRTGFSRVSLRMIFLIKHPHSKVNISHFCYDCI